MQQTLLRDDQSMRSRRNEDPLDLARKAKVRASASEPHAPAENILTGQTRDIPGKETHQWTARMSPGGAWIELAWDQPVTLREVQITFDTGFQRELTLSSSDSITRGIVRAAQPETVKDYRLFAGDREIKKITGNFQRLNRHRIDPVTTQTLRLHVDKMNGSDFARVFEIRCYA